MLNHVARIILGLHLALAILIGSSGMAYRLNTESEEASQAKEAAALSSHATLRRCRTARCGQSLHRWISGGTPVTLRNGIEYLFQQWQRRSTAGHTLPNGLNAPLLT